MLEDSFPHVVELFVSVRENVAAVVSDSELLLVVLLIVEASLALQVCLTLDVLLLIFKLWGRLGVVYVLLGGWDVLDLEGTSEVFDIKQLLQAPLDEALVLDDGVLLVKLLELELRLRLGLPLGLLLLHLRCDINVLVDCLAL
jgi:hypothetical protein